MVSQQALPLKTVVSPDPIITIGWEAVPFNPLIVNGVGYVPGASCKLSPGKRYVTLASKSVGVAGIILAIAVCEMTARGMNKKK
jgi:hypothetical protein